MSRRHDLGERAGAVFDDLLDERGDMLARNERVEGEAFWDWLGEFDRPAEIAPERRRLGPVMAAAAALVVALVGGASWWTAQPQAPQAPQRYASGHGERRMLRLDDGSIVTLAASSGIEIRYRAGERRIRLDRGEALFDVAHDASRPFIVETRHGEVKALGTAFDVALRRDEAAVTVVEGVIRIALPNIAGASKVSDPIIKTAHRGDRVRFGLRGQGASSIGFIGDAQPADPDHATAWTHGQLSFRGEPLEEVLAQVNLYAREQVTLTDRRFAGTPVYGVIEQGDTAAVRDLLSDPDAVAIGSPVNP